MTTADYLFTQQGYEKKVHRWMNAENESRYIFSEYIMDGADAKICITFNNASHTVEKIFYNKATDICKPCPIDMMEFRAIAKRIEELGWLEDTEAKG